MRKRNSGLLATAAAAALVCGMAGSASAFDVVDWSWEKTVTESVIIDFYIHNDIIPTGVVEIEKLQMHFGDITATATVHDIANNPPGEGGQGGTIFIEEYFTGSIQYLDGGGGEVAINPIQSGNFNDINGPNQLFVELDPTALTLGNVNEQADNVDFQIKISGAIDPLLLGGSFDAVDLPSIKNAATAVANNQQIYSTSALLLHDAQIAAGDINDLNGDCDECNEPNALAFLVGAYLLTLVDNELEGINLHTDLAALTIIGAATGFVEPANITASAEVFNILNATVDNSATAVGNNASFEIAAATPTNATMIADLTQLLIGDVTATAYVHHVAINGYANLGVLDGPIVSNVATAVGNNLNIKVDGCGGCATTP